MDICALKTAIVDCCNSDDFTVEKIEGFIESYRIGEIDRRFLDICKLAAESCDIKITDFFSKSRKPDIILSKRLAFVYYKSKELTYESIGYMFGYDHATILHGVKTIKNDIECNHKSTVKAVTKFYKQLEKYESNTIKANSCSS